MKTKAHKYLTKIAIASSSLNLSKQDIKYILKGTHHEDYYPLKTRATNWHFYRLEPNSPIPMKVKRFGIWCKPTSENIFQIHINHLKAPKSRKDYFKTLGKILHHIQDMSTPSHVVPIYHGPGKKDYYEKYMMKYLTKIQLADTVQINSTPNNFNDLYHSAASKTLNYLQDKSIEGISPDNELVNISFDKIWTKYTPGNKMIEGFGKYGPYANCFSIKRSRNSYVSRDGYRIKKTEIKKIYKELCDKAIQDSCDALIFALNSEELI